MHGAQSKHQHIFQPFILAEAPDTILLQLKDGSSGDANDSPQNNRLTVIPLCFPALEERTIVALYWRIGIQMNETHGGKPLFFQKLRWQDWQILLSFAVAP